MTSDDKVELDTPYPFSILKTSKFRIISQRFFHHLSFFKAQSTYILISVHSDVYSLCEIRAF